jgi:hypothetical protein
MALGTLAKKTEKPAIQPILTLKPSFFEPKVSQIVPKNCESLEIPAVWSLPSKSFAATKPFTKKSLTDNASTTYGLPAAV